MNATLRVSLAVVGICLATPAFGEGLLKRPDEWVPFLERIDAKEFLVVEGKFGESLSDAADLVIYDAWGPDLRKSLALTRQANKGWRLEIIPRVVELSPISRKSVLLPTDIAERLLAVMELTLTTQLYPPTGQAITYPTNSGSLTAYWMNLRIDKSRAISGVVLLSRCENGQESKLPFLNLMRRLMSCAENSGDEIPLVNLDLAISDLRRSYHPAD